MATKLVTRNISTEPTDGRAAAAAAAAARICGRVACMPHAGGFYCRSAHETAIHPQLRVLYHVRPSVRPGGWPAANSDDAML